MCALAHEPVLGISWRTPTRPACFEGVQGCAHTYACPCRCMCARVRASMRVHVLVYRCASIGGRVSGCDAAGSDDEIKRAGRQAGSWPWSLLRFVAILICVPSRPTWRRCPGMCAGGLKAMGAAVGSIRWGHLVTECPRPQDAIQCGKSKPQFRSFTGCPAASADSAAWLRALLERDPRDRLSAQEALKHPNFLRPWNEGATRVAISN